MKISDLIDLFQMSLNRKAWEREDKDESNKELILIARILASKIEKDNSWITDEIMNQINYYLNYNTVLSQSKEMENTVSHTKKRVWVVWFWELWTNFEIWCKNISSTILLKQYRNSKKLSTGWWKNEMFISRYVSYMRILYSRYIGWDISEDTMWEYFTIDELKYLEKEYWM